MKPVSGRKFCKLLEQNGWKLLRVHGSHYIYGKSGKTVRISVPVHSNKLLKAGLLKQLLKLAEIAESCLQ